MKDKKGKVVGFNVLEDECIWMKSGIVAFKRCRNAYDCNNCQYDKAMAAAVRAGKEQGKKEVPSFREKSKEQEYTDRLCRHMLTGHVSGRRCANDFRCDTCEFDQAMDYIDDIYPVGTVPIIEVNGYRYSDSYYYHEGHAWARVEYGGRVRVGLDDFSLKLLGRPTAWQLPRIGHGVYQGKPGWVLIREQNHASVLSPIDGTVVAVNLRAVKQPALVHADAYEGGWLFLVEPDRLKKNLEALYFGERGKERLLSEVRLLQEMALGEYGQLAATGAVPVDDVLSQVPEIGWEALARTFLRSGGFRFGPLE